MAGFTDTVDLERSLLKALTTSEVLARTFISSITEDLFTALSRKLIFALAKKNLRENGTLLTKRIFTYEVGKRFKEADIVPFLGEWNLVETIDDYDPPEEIISQLKLAKSGRDILKISEDVMTKLQSGDVENAIIELKRRAVLLTNAGVQIKHSKPLSDITERLKLIEDKKQHPELFAGLKTGFPTLDKCTGGLFPGELTLLAGVTGLGKSTLCKVLAKNIVTLNPGKNVLHVANEEYETQVNYKYDSLFTDIPYSDFKNPENMSDVELARWKDYMQNKMHENGRGDIYTLEVPAFSDVTLIEQEYRYLENQGVKIDCIIIDHLPHVKPIQQAWGENDEMKKAAADCKEIARLLKVPVIIPTQAATEVEEKQLKGKRASKMDVYGSKAQVHVANTFLILTYKGTDGRQSQLHEEDRDRIWLIDCKKNRDGKSFCFNAIHHVQSGQVEEISQQEAEDCACMDSGESGYSASESDYSYSSKKNLHDAMDELDSPMPEVPSQPAVNVNKFIKKNNAEARQAMMTRDIPPGATIGDIWGDPIPYEEDPPSDEGLVPF